jgi:uncharacterized protein (DUF2236 family)
VPAARPYPVGDPGLFGPGSVTWRIHGDLAMLIGGLRAVLAQTMHPLAMAGVADHSNYRTDPWGRLHRTGHYIGVTTFGSTRQALDAVVAVRRIHERVRGIAPDGRAYSATDPHLLSWVHATEVHSFLVAYERYGQRPLAGTDADRYIAEMAVLGIEIGADDVPASRAELRDYFAAIRPELAAGDKAREAVRFLLWPPVAPVVRPAYSVICAAGLGLLPGWVRRDLRVPSLPLADPLAVRPAARLLLGALGWSLGPSPTVEAARTRTELADA